MAESRPRLSAGSRRASRASAESASGNGLWHRPQILNLMADILLLFGATGLGYALVAWLIARQAFPVHDVILSTPPGRVTMEQLEYAAHSSLKGNFFTVDLDQIRAAFEKLPWVRRAEVRRVWPDAVELRLEEHQAVAYWTVNDSGETRLVNRHGEVFTASSDQTMPSFSGPEGMAGDVLIHYLRFRDMVAPLKDVLVSVGLSEREAWQLKLADGLVIRLGRARSDSDLDERLERFVKAYPQAEQKTELKVAVADLRYPNGFTLKGATSSKGKQ